VVTATFAAPVEGLAARLDALHARLPIIGARLRGDEWVAGAAPPVRQLAKPLGACPLVDRFDLGTDAPLRVAATPDGIGLAVAGHHAAFDGLSLVALLGALAGGELPSPMAVTHSAPTRNGQRAGLFGAARRVLRPADRIAPSIPPPPHETFATQPVQLHGPDVTARIVAASVAAGADHNARRGRRWRRIAVSVGIGGSGAIGNTASYRRIELDARADPRAAVTAALRDRSEPFELSRAPALLRFLAPLARRLSDSILVSNLGVHQVPGATSVSFFPVARGRSAVAVGAVGLVGGPSSVSVRARDLSEDDVGALLGEVVVCLK
jgi:hypothetical protein